MIFLVIFQSFTNAAANVLTQELIGIRKIGNNWQSLFLRGSYSLFCVLFFAIGYFTISLDSLYASPYIVGGSLVISSALLYVTYPLRRTAFLHEKMTTLQPFLMARQVFSVVFAFVILREDVSIWTFLLSLLAIGVLIFASMEGYRIVFNRYTLMVLISSIIQTIQLQFILICIKAFAPAWYFFLESMIIAVIAVVLIAFKKEWGEYRHVTLPFLKKQLFVNAIGFIAAFLWLLLYSKLGVVMTSLTTLLYLVFFYPIAYYRLGEIPRKKDIFAAIMIAVCIGLGTYLR